MNDFKKEMLDAIYSLNESGLLSKCIICGSWGMYFYNQIFENFESPMRTTDFDILLPNASRINSGGISKFLIEKDYVRFDDYLSGKTKYYSKNGFEIEFLTLPNRNMDRVITIKGDNIGAEALPKIAPIVWNYITVDYDSYRINIPSPVSFCIQKLLINSERKDYKKEKDIDAIKYVLFFINASKKYSQEFIDTYSNCPKKWKKTIKDTIDFYKLETPINL